MSRDVLIQKEALEGAEPGRCLARVAAFDGEQEPVLRARRGPWANTEPAAPDADDQIAAWLRSGFASRATQGYSPLLGWVPGTAVHLALAVGALGSRPDLEGERAGAELRKVLASAQAETPLEQAAVAWAGRRVGARRSRRALPPLSPDERPWPATMFVVDQELARAAHRTPRAAKPKAGVLDGLGELVDLVHRAGVDHGGASFSRSLFTAAYGGVVLDRRDTFDAAHATAESLLGLFEMRKHAFGLVGAVTEPADLRDLCIIRSVWRLLAEVTGDHRFLNGALKLAEWMRLTVLPAARGETVGKAPWHGMRRSFPDSEGPFFSTEVAALHLLAASSEARVVADLATRRGPRG